MTTVQRFEDLICFQRAREMTCEIYRSLNDCKDRGFKDQIQRASVSVVSNIAEGFESGTKSEFINYLYIAKASAGEVRAQLYVALDVGYLNNETFKYLNGLAVECSRLTGSFVGKVKSGAMTGLQFKEGNKQDDGDDLIKEYAPEVYKRFHPNG